ncbi:MAG TPA: hypothetical protein VH186_35530 [Chloroflexia bacterium]|nr:hypothetical protein [Chloroflexia bacterium]
MKGVALILMFLLMALLLSGCTANGQYNLTLITKGSDTVNAAETLDGELIIYS